MPDDMYEHWARWKREGEEREANFKQAEEKAKKEMEDAGMEPPGPDDQERYLSYPQEQYEKFVVRGALPFNVTKFLQPNRIYSMYLAIGGLPCCNLLWSGIMPWDRGLL